MTLSWTHTSGIYLGVFHSSIKFRSDEDLNVVSAPFLGISGSAGDFFDYNIFYYAYTYPGASSNNYEELWFTASKAFNDFTLTAEVTPTTSDWFGVEGWDGINYALHPSYQHSSGWTINGSIGKQDLEGIEAEGWRHWNLGTHKTYTGYTLDIRYHDSNIDDKHLVYGSQVDIFNARVVLGISKAF